MKLVTYRASVEAEARLGVIIDDLVVDVANLGADYDEDLPETMLDMIDLGRPALQTLAAILDDAEGVFAPGTATALANVKLLAPIPRGHKMPIDPNVVSAMLRFLVDRLGPSL